MAYEQLDIFSFLTTPQEGTQDKFCWDSDINDIYSRLIVLINRHNLSCGKAEFAIWPHVPQYGYRLTFTIPFTRQTYTDEFLHDLSEIVKFAKGRKVELSLYQPYFLGDDDIGNMHIYSTFMDKERQKIRRA